MASSAEGDEVRTEESAAGQVAATDANDAAQSSGADAKDEKPKSILDAVMAATDKAAQSSGAQTQDTEDPDAGDQPAVGVAKPEGKDKPKDEDAELGGVTEEELRGYKPKTRRRVEQLLASNKTIQTELDKARPAVESFQRLTTFVRDAGLTSEDVNTGFELMRLMKTDPVKAWEAVQPIVHELARITGNLMPDDLRQQVAEGRITEAAAAELARTRATSGLNRQAADREAERRRQDDANRAHETNVTAIAGEISKWETSWSKSDPDYPLKRERVQEKIELAFQKRGAPKTPQEAVVLAEECRKAVDAELKRFRPTRTAVNDTPASGGAAATAKPQPKNMLEAVTRAAAGG